MKSENIIQFRAKSLKVGNLEGKLEDPIEALLNEFKNNDILNETPVKRPSRPKIDPDIIKAYYLSEITLNLD